MTAPETALTLSREQVVFIRDHVDPGTSNYVIVPRQKLKQACSDAIAAHDLADRIAVLEAESAAKDARYQELESNYRTAQANWELTLKRAIAAEDAIDKLRSADRSDLQDGGGT